ncbi:interferon regulatory factor 10 isoform X1 [Misgurnus anguillicaudatus]|uniref:interferon regulatory factor 10 isoform X1 n=1 Tax=Misgurnus anguillicaudatus TaxID=75329 RepID=UPI002434BDBA|nr:interferon regulatory factor 10 isoform X1 [Misgurnus anguillicaudatus]
MEDKSRHMRLREWLIAQIDSGKYAGLSWENQEKTMFRIPWKHAAKQDYRQHQDAALFKAWAMYKGKFREGMDKADPSTWKTRLRCALNKSSDFQEVPERSQLDISEPYKVYRIMDDTGRVTDMAGNAMMLHEDDSSPALRGIQQVNLPGDSDRGSSERSVNGRPYASPIINTEGGGNAVPQAVPLYLSQVPLSDFRLEVRLFYYGNLVQSDVASSPDGCFILQGCAPVGNERIYGPCEAKKVFFPRPDIVPLPPGITEAMSRLLPHLEKGVLVWVAPDGVFIKRFCQGRVYWDGPLAEHRDKPNKLERERTCKLLDTTIFLQELQGHQQGGGPEPRYSVDLCFGEEFPDPNQPKSKKLITAQVIPLFAVECLGRHDTSNNVEMKCSPSEKSCMQSDT